MFERFTDRARNVGHRHVGTEHLLLAMLAGDGGGLAAKILADSGLDFAELRTRTLAAIPG